VNTVVRDFSLLLDQVTGEDVHIAVELAAGPAVIEGHRAHVEQMLLNLAVNARDAMPGGGTVKITTALDFAPDANVPPATTGWVVIRVEDDGCGMDDDVKQHLFEPFFTTKRPGRGTGLGLTTVHTLVTQAGGAIDVATERGRGTAVSLRLPLCPRPADRTKDASSTEGPMPAEPSWPSNALPVWQGETVLVVDDEAAVRQMIEATIAGQGAEVVSAASAEEALERIAPLAQLSLIISDVHLPGMSGPDLVARLTAARPGLASLLISGRARPETIEPMRFLPKPFGPDQLNETLHRLSRPGVPSQVPTPTETGTPR
jgi:CheY-like chemotaxis protein